MQYTFCTFTTFNHEKVFRRDFIHLAFSSWTPVPGESLMSNSQKNSEIYLVHLVIRFETLQTIRLYNLLVQFRVRGPLPSLLAVRMHKIMFIWRPTALERSSFLPESLPDEASPTARLSLRRSSSTSCQQTDLSLLTIWVFPDSLWRCWLIQTSLFYYQDCSNYW